MMKSLPVLLFALLLLGAGCSTASTIDVGEMPPAPEPGMEDELMPQDDSDTLTVDGELEFTDDIGHDESAEVTKLSCDNELMFSWEVLMPSGEIVLSLESGSSAFLPHVGDPISLEEAVSASGTRYESMDASIVVLEKGGEYTVMSDDRIAAENCTVVE